MYIGTVTFRAVITDNGLKFPSCEFNPHHASVEKVVIESQSGFEILSTVHLSGVVTERVGRALANKVLTAVLDRLAFRYSLAIEDSQIISSWFAPVEAPPGAEVHLHSGELAISGQQADLVVSIPPADLKTQLERTTLTGEPLFSSYRLALQSRSPVEKFMQLYNLLLRFFEDEQLQVDNFIRREEPTVQETRDPRPGRSNMETVYTRLRNEFAHRRLGVNIENAKFEMVQQVGGLSSLTKRAIELQA